MAEEPRVRPIERGPPSRLPRYRDLVRLPGIARVDDPLDDDVAHILAPQLAMGGARECANVPAIALAACEAASNGVQRESARKIG